MNRLSRSTIAMAVALSAASASAQEAAVTPYGVRNPAAPAELDAFAFLIGQWEGGGRTILDDGNVAEFDGVTWIGRYVLDGMAIADEGHATGPDGRSYLGVSLRHFDPETGWIIEYINVTNSFVRRQVNPRSGSVDIIGDTVVVTASDGGTVAREHYRPSGDDRFIYRLDISNDGGGTWTPGSVEMTMTRVEQDQEE